MKYQPAVEILSIVASRGYCLIAVITVFVSSLITNLFQERIKLWVENINLRDFQMRITTSLKLIKM